jgi:hypothetical protein
MVQSVAIMPGRRSAVGGRRSAVGGRRSAVGMAMLPFGIPVEIEAEIEIDGG